MQAGEYRSEGFAKGKSLRLQKTRRAARTRTRIHWSCFLEDGNSGDVEVDVLEMMQPRSALIAFPPAAREWGGERAGYGLTLDASTLHGPCCAQPSPSQIPKDGHAHLYDSQRNSLLPNDLGSEHPWSDMPVVPMNTQCVSSL
ncbi:hypothetical protein HBI56_092160 [Parastagonospora nodorum]|uniref:Uncharacterized protein n=1 Tax=Phaeosphaeria nodorum (strain SN15 / ATCC MYA-4574 / FGSC 10173) TaxID=321614 RepID=A0A7U2F7K6_PHANO|nr:hypothetical protein HBH56_087560 [Parastagonospora nodorum]QRC97985.1 hypothetical protein JI435_411330 [Parastagonospora nodorum SN15]KAH3936560.1 hypothetical protein HBH54_022200 [Parastagonospora nodorum]KAH3945583.1 hypothetical protein HBH53_139310 [Parastagonospora nodorum]KAH3966307.1 hypothetical protein HBH51_146040 [Parastagonospora nodorum]